MPFMYTCMNMYAWLVGTVVSSIDGPRASTRGELDDGANGGERVFSDEKIVCLMKIRALVL